MKWRCWQSSCRLASQVESASQKFKTDCRQDLTGHFTVVKKLGYAIQPVIMPLPIGTSELRYLVQIILIWNLLTFNHLTAEADEHSTRLHISTWIQRSQHLYEHVVGGENYPVAHWTWVQKLTTWLTVPFLCCFSPSFKFRIEQLLKPFRQSWSTASEERGKVNRPCVSTPDLALWWVVSNGLKTDSNLAAAVEGKFITRRGQAGWVSCSCFSWKDFKCYSGNCIYIFSANNII